MTDEEVMQKIAMALNVTYRPDISDILEDAIKAIEANDLLLARCHIAVALAMQVSGRRVTLR